MLIWITAAGHRAPSTEHRAPWTEHHRGTIRSIVGEPVPFSTGPFPFAFPFAFAPATTPSKIGRVRARTMCRCGRSGIEHISIKGPADEKGSRSYRSWQPLISSYQSAFRKKKKHIYPLTNPWTVATNKTTRSPIQNGRSTSLCLAHNLSHTRLCTRHVFQI